jgi:uncharacterized membrane protein YbhN (UPF0104 family)
MRVPRQVESERPIGSAAERSRRLSRLRRFAWRHKLKLVGPVLMAWIVFRTGPAGLWECVGGARFGIFVLALPLAWLSLLVKSFRWRYLVAGGKVRLPVLESMVHYFRSVFWGAVTPGRIGEFYRARYVRDRGGSLGLGMASVAVDRLLDFALLLPVAAYLLVAFSGVPLHALSRPGRCVLPGAAAAAALAWISLRIRAARRPARSHGVPGKVAAMADAVVSAWREARRWPAAVWGGGFMLSAAATALLLAQRFAIGRAVGIHLDFATFSGIIAVSALLSALPVSVQGVGTRDAALVFCLGRLEVRPEEALALSGLILLTMLVNSALALLSMFWREQR